MKKIQKGDYGYIRSQKKKRVIITSIMFLLPIILFVTGLIITKTRLNMFTFAAIMGCLPASRSAVGMVMILLQKPMEESRYTEFEQHSKGMISACELCVSAYEKNTPLDCLVVSGTQVAAFTASEKVDVPFAQKHIEDILKGNSYKSNVKIFTDWKRFLERVDFLGEKEEATEEEAEKSHMMKRVIQAISL